MGFRSGEYGGRNKILHPIDSIKLTKKHYDGFEHYPLSKHCFFEEKDSYLKAII